MVELSHDRGKNGETRNLLSAGSIDQAPIETRAVLQCWPMDRISKAFAPHVRGAVLPVGSASAQGARRPCSGFRCEDTPDRAMA